MIIPLIDSIGTFLQPVRYKDRTWLLITFPTFGVEEKERRNEKKKWLMRDNEIDWHCYRPGLLHLVELMMAVTDRQIPRSMFHSGTTLWCHNWPPTFIIIQYHLHSIFLKTSLLFNSIFKKNYLSFYLIYFVILFITLILYSKIMWLVLLLLLNQLKNRMT